MDDYGTVGETARIVRARSGGLKPRVLGPKRFCSNRRKSHDQFRIAVKRFNADDTPDAKLRVPDPHAWPQHHARRLILVFVGVGGCRVFLDAAATTPPPIRVGSKFIVSEVSLIRRR